MSTSSHRRPSTTSLQPMFPNGIDLEQQDIPHTLPPNLFPEVDDSTVIGMNNLSKIHDQHLAALKNTALFKQYQLSQKRFFCLIKIWPLSMFYFAAVATRFNLENIGTNGLLFDIAFAGYMTTNVVFSVFIVAHLIVDNTQKCDHDRFWYRISERCLLRWFGGRIVDILAILGIVTVGFYLLARVNVGECSSPTSIWLSQTCNPVASSRSIPHDEVLLLYSSPISVQIAFRGISVEALVICWICVNFFVIYSVVQVEGWLQLWTIVYTLVFMNISYEIEKLMRVTFVQTRAMLDAERSKLISDLQIEAEVNLTKLRNRHVLELVEVSAENERKLREKEIFQLRSLMGNVAHDLKTPLHSIEADLEVLNVFITKIPRILLDVTTAEFQSKGVGDSFDPISVFDSLNATCKFMEMAINRSQDFMKASNNIALIPIMETFELKSALSMSVTCINHLQSARMITLHPFNTAEICSHLISDKHWLIENSLCLLSNAMKYSDDGVVDIRVKLIESPAYDHIPKSRNNAEPRTDDHRRNSNQPTETDQRRNSKQIVDTDAISISMAQLQRSCSTHFATESKDSHAHARDSRTRQMVQLSVEDTGIGISEESRKNLFQPFKQAQRMAGGTGLGLYSLSKRIESLGGSAGVTSRADGKQGSTFWFTFPYRPDVEAARVDCHVEAVIGVDDLVIDTILPKRILVVDDSLSILKVTSRLLKMNGHTVETASNGSIGLKRLKEAYDLGSFDMVLTDLQMPVMDGVEATSRFRKFEEDKMTLQHKSGIGKRRKRLLIVGMSANSDFQCKQEALNSGMDYFVTKPFAYKDLQPILSNSMWDSQSMMDI